MKWQRDNIPYFGEVMYITAKCQCSFRFADTMILSSKEPMRYELSIESPEDLDSRVIRSTSGTIRIPEMGIIIEPGTVSDSYVTNIEGVLQRVKEVLITASKWVQEDEEKFTRSQELLCMLNEVIESNENNYSHCRRSPRKQCNYFEKRLLLSNSQKKRLRSLTQA